jgi:hypothetical protein
VPGAAGVAGRAVLVQLAAWTHQAGLLRRELTWHAVAAFMAVETGGVGPALHVTHPTQTYIAIGIVASGWCCACC